MAFVILFLILLGVFAGTFGALLGLGGSIILVPILTLLGGSMGISPVKAAAIGLVCVVATSCSASSVYLKRGWANVRVGLPLQLATVLGAITGAWIAPFLPETLFHLLFAGILLYAAGVLWTRAGQAEEESGETIPDYEVRHQSAGAAVSYVTGNVAGLLGIGGGPIQVPLMHLVMGLPMKAATATSSFIMGMTATAAALLYYARGEILVALAAPLALGVFLGAQLGSRLAPRLKSRTLRRLMTLVLVVLAAGLLYSVLGTFLSSPEAP